MARLRDLVTAVALIGLTGVSLLALVQVIGRAGQQPVAAAERDLRQWLTEHDLAAESQQTQLDVARRFESDVRRGALRPADAEDLSPEQRQRLEDNLALLVRRWVTERVDRYFALPEEQRPAYINGQIEAFEQMGRQVAALSSDAGLPGDATGGDLSAWGGLFQRTQAWVEQAPPEEQARIREFQIAVQRQWIIRQIQQSATQFEQPRGE